MKNTCLLLYSRPMVLRRMVYSCVSVLLILTGVAPIASAGAAEPQVRVAAPTAWVEPVAAPYESQIPLDDLWNGVYYLLVDRQVKVSAGELENYQRYVAKAVNESGVDQIANIAIDFEPDHQTLVLHSVDIVREGVRSSRLDPDRVRLLHRASSLEQRMFDNTQTASLFLDDVQAGDIVEYAYTVRGGNPVFDGRYFGTFAMQWGVPVSKNNGRLLVADDRPVQLAHHHIHDLAKPVARDGYLEYRWKKREAEARNIEDDAPGWYQPRPLVEWSQFSDWNHVARWAEPLYRPPAPASDAVRGLAEQIRREHAGDEERLLAALRFVQGEVRYLSVALGVHSHAPHQPDLVLKRRFGDCKDKTLLLLALLAELGLHAQPALVNTQLHRGIKERLPSPGLFDHVLVTLSLDGRRYWLDPTLPVQPSPLSRLVQPDFGYALIIGRETRDLTPVPEDTGIAWEETIEATLDLSGSIDEPVPYSLSIRHGGRAAEWARRTLDEVNRTELQRQYLNFYTQYYPSMVRTDALRVQDDPRWNRLSFAEQYAIEDFWQASEPGPGVVGSVLAPDITRYLWGTSNTVRDDPYALRHPMNITQVTRVLLPGPWQIDGEHHRIDDPHFLFSRTIELEGQVISIVDHYETLSDHVPSEAIRQFTANLKRARDSMDYGLFQYDAGSNTADPVLGRWNWPVTVFALVVLVLCCAAALRVYRLDPPPPLHVNDRLAGISGWLIIPAIGAVMTPFVMVYEMAEIVQAYTPESWYWLTNPASPGYAPGWRPALLFELTSNLFLLTLSVLVLITFFKRRRIAPKLYFASLTLSLLVQMIILGYVVRVPEFGLTQDEIAQQSAQVARAFIVAMIWGSYMLVSKRVESTFTRGWRESAPGGEAHAPGIPR